MANTNLKFPVKKPYVKVQEHCTNSNGSFKRKPDLSYSYSCVGAFRRNQYIIQNLAAFQQNCKYGSLTDQHGLFSLSGNREKPICQPFYYSCASEHEESAFRESSNKNETSANIQSSVNSENHPKYSDPNKNLFIQWLKYQFQNINSLLPVLIKPNSSFFTKCCKKNENIKLEMLLNNIDENTKSILINYVKDLNLNHEERYSLCNESIIEIDITPILSHPRHLQTFLTYLRSIKSNITEAAEGIDTKLGHVGGKGCVIETPSVPFNCHFNRVHTQHWSDQDGDIYKCGRKSFFEQNMLHKTQAVEEKEISMGTLNIRTVRTPSPRDKFKKQRGNSTMVPNTKYKGKTFLNEAHIFSSRTRFTGYHNKNFTEHENNVELPCDIDLSCKCIMHQNQKDYNRYNDQCSFGKGDEYNSSLMKHVAVSENISLSKSCCPNNLLKSGNENELNKLYYQPLVKKRKKVTCNIKRKKSKSISRSQALIKNKPNNNNLKYIPTKINFVTGNKLTTGNFDEKSDTFKSNKHYNSGVSDDLSCDSHAVQMDGIGKLVYSTDNGNDNYINDNGNYNSTESRTSINEKYKQIVINACFETLDCHTKSEHNQKSNSSYENNDNKNVKWNKIEREELKDKKSKTKHLKQSSFIKILYRRNNNYNFSSTNSSVKYHKELVKNRLSSQEIKSKEMFNVQDKASTIDNNRRIEDQREKQSKFEEKNKSEHNKETIIYDSKNNQPYKSKKMVIRINSIDTQTNAEATTRPNKKNSKLDLFRPLTIYRSISTLFKRNSRSYNEATSEKIMQCQKAQSKLETNISEKELELITKGEQSKSFPTSENKQCLSEDSTASLNEICDKPRHIESLILSNLEKLYTELKNQRIEINNIKRSLNDHNIR